MSGAHCIDFYNKSTLTFIVFIFVSHRAFSSTAKTSAESFAAAVCSCRALWGGSEFLGLPLGVAWVKLHPLEPCSALQAVRERGPAAPALTAWILRGEGATTGTVHSLPVSAPSAERIGVVSVSMRIHPCRQCCSSYCCLWPGNTALAHCCTAEDAFSLNQTDFIS